MRISNQALEYSKLSDKMRVKFNCDLDMLQAAYKKFDLKTDPVLSSFYKIAQAQKETEQKEEFERATPKPEVMEELLKRGKELGNPQYKQDGTMTFDYFLGTMKLATEFSMR
jgi:hypothetical protein